MACGSIQLCKGKLLRCEIWDGDLYLYSVETKYEADEQQEAGFTVKSLEYYGA
jgi:hypothetical protein